MGRRGWNLRCAERGRPDIDNAPRRLYCPCMKPESQQHILPLALLIGGLVCGAVSWTLTGTIFWVVTGVGAALIIAGVFVASRVGAARRVNKWED
jgi:hypothetical protein